MKISIKLIPIVGLFILHSLKTNANTKWIDGLVENIKSDQKIHQVIILFNDGVIPSNSRFTDLIKKLSNNKPILKIILQKSANNSLTSNDSANYNPRVSLFIITNPEIDYQFDYLKQLSNERRRPKCLVLLTKELPNYRKFFTALWLQQFLEVTIVSLEKSDLQFDTEQVRDTVINYNPFSGKLSKNVASFRTIWFPDKMKNLHRYPLITSLLPNPPDVFRHETKSGSVHYSGLAIEKLKTFSQIMNFTLVALKNQTWGTLSCLKNTTPGIYLSLSRNEVQLAAFDGPVGLYKNRKIEFCKGLRRFQFGMIVPVVRKERKLSIEIEWQIKKALTVMILPLLVWFVSKIMRFQPRTWKIEYLYRIIFGIPTPNEPTKCVERIVFAAFLFGCLTFSSEIFTAIADVQLITESSFEYENLQEVLNSNLQINIIENYRFVHRNVKDVVLQQILNKSVSRYSDLECVELLLKYKNWTCIVTVRGTEFIVRNKIDKCGQPLTKFIVDGFLSGPGFMLLGSGTPYAKRIDQITQRIIASGISTKWMQPYTLRKYTSAQIGKSCVSEVSHSKIIMYKLLLLPIIGYIFSISTFIMELIVNWTLKEIRGGILLAMHCLFLPGLYVMLQDERVPYIPK